MFPVFKNVTKKSVAKVYHSVFLLSVFSKLLKSIRITSRKSFFQISEMVVAGRVRRTFDVSVTALAVALDVSNECC